MAAGIHYSKKVKQKLMGSNAAAMSSSPSTSTPSTASAFSMTQFRSILPAVLPSDSSHGRSAPGASVATDAAVDTAKPVSLDTVSSAKTVASRSPLGMPLIPTAVRAVILVIVHLQLQQQCFQLYKVPKLRFTEADATLFGQWTGAQQIPMLPAVLDRLQQWAQGGYLTTVSTGIGAVTVLAPGEYAEQVYLLHLL
jgi:hypothetical protein